MALSNGVPPPSNNYKYFTRYITGIVEARQEDISNGKDYELEFFDNLANLQLQLLLNNKDKDRLIQRVGFVLADIFYLCSVSDVVINIESQRRPMYRFRSKKAVMENLIRYVKEFMYQYRDLHSCNIRADVTRSAINTWAGRVCQLLLNITEFESLHTLIACRIQQDSGIESVLRQRDEILEQRPEAEEQIFSVRIFPATYDLTKTCWDKVTEVLIKCGLGGDLNHVKLTTVAHKVQAKYLDTGREQNESKQITEEKFADDFLCDKSQVDITDFHTLLGPLARWLYVSNFSDICQKQFHGVCPFLRPSVASTELTQPKTALQRDVEMFLQRMRRDQDEID
jgi:hypothetical protein